MSEAGRTVLLAISIAYVLYRFVKVAFSKKNFVEVFEIIILIFMGIFLINI